MFVEGERVSQNEAHGYLLTGLGSGVNVLNVRGTAQGGAGWDALPRASFPSATVTREAALAALLPPSDMAY